MTPPVRVQYRKTFAALYGLLAAVALGAAYYSGTQLGYKAPTTIRVQRPLITNHASFAQVQANLDRSPAGRGQYVAGFQCLAWSNGNRVTQLYPDLWGDWTWT